MKANPTILVFELPEISRNGKPFNPKTTAIRWYDVGTHIESNNGIKIDHSDLHLIFNKRVCCAPYPTVSGKRNQRLHRMIAAPHGGVVVDHINRDIRDNRRCNLRTEPTARTNVINRRYLRPKTSQYRGVSIMRGKWRSAITSCRKSIHLGVFASELEAAAAYNEAAVRHFGTAACLNAIC